MARYSSQINSLIKSLFALCEILLNNTFNNESINNDYNSNVQICHNIILKRSLSS